MSRRASGVSVRSAPAPRWNTIRSSIFVVLLISPASAQYCRDSLLAAALVTPGTGVGLDAALGPDVALLGAPGDDALGSDAGAVIVYALDSATPTVVDAQPWRASDGAGGDFFGASVAVDGDVAVIGAPGRDAMGVPDIGAAYVFRRVGGHWAEEQQLLPSTFGTDLRFGRDLDLSGDRIIVGHRLGAVVFRWNGATWAEEVTLGSDGRDVSIDGTFAACRSGLYSYDAAASSWVLELTGLSWEQVSVDDDVFLVYRGGITVDIYRRDPLTGTWPVVQSFGTPSATPFHAELSAGMLLYVVSGHLSVSAPVTGASILNLGPFMGGVSFTGPAAAWNGRVLAASSGPAYGVLSDVRCYQDVINTTFCSAATNSTGGPGHLDVVGARDLGLNDATLVAIDLPPDTIAMFLASRTLVGGVTPAGSQGSLCLGATPGRFDAPGQLQATGGLGRCVLPVDLQAMPTPAGPTAVLAGEMWVFQAWFRDRNPGPTSNFTAAAIVTWQ